LGVVDFYYGVLEMHDLFVLQRLGRTGGFEELIIGGLFIQRKTFRLQIAIKSSFRFGFYCYKILIGIFL
jgi:hypothetical protein